MNAGFVLVSKRCASERRVALGGHGTRDGIARVDSLTWAQMLSQSFTPSASGVMMT